MAVAFRAVGAIGAAASGNVTCAAPAGIANDDILVCVTVADDAVAVTGPAGWSVLGTVDNSNIALRTVLLWKLAASESGSYVFTHTAGSAIAAQVAAYSGAASSPFGTAFSLRGDEANGTAMAATSITPANNNSLIVLAGLIDGETNSMGSPTGGGLTWTQNADAGDAVTSFKRIGWASATQATAAAIAPSATISASAWHNTVAFALQISGGGASYKPRAMLLGVG